MLTIIGAAFLASCFVAGFFATRHQTKPCPHAH